MGHALSFPDLWREDWVREQKDLSVPEEWWEAQVTQEFDFIQKDD